LQEVVGPDDALPDTPLQCAFLADGVWPDVAFGVNAPNTLGPIGNGLLSKFPIEAHQNLTISGTRGERRGALHCVVRTQDAGRVHVVSLHLGLLGTLRREQADRLWNRLDAEIPAGAPLVVAGDFNDWPGTLDRALRRRTGMRDALDILHGDVARTWPSVLPMLRLDRLYLRHLEPYEARVLAERPWSRLSDHAPLLVDARSPDRRT
jgi:endonuclease/exonuclease/phosphatase family metal-dependent hydrolase